MAQFTIEAHIFDFNEDIYGQRFVLYSMSGSGGKAVRIWRIGFKITN